VNINFIDSQRDLDILVDSIPLEAVISFDSEFVRRSTYYAKLSLIQICIKGEVYVIDCLRAEINQLWQKMVDAKQIICHAPRQDFEILYNETGILPKKIFDTQTAAKFSGYRANLSYAELCQDICNIELDKSHQNCNWLRRKVTDSMMKYAALDVLYLEKICNVLNEKVGANNQKDNYDSALYNGLLNQSIYKNKCENAWQKIRFNHRDPEFVDRVKILAFHREEMAANLNIPKGFLFSDGQLLAICKILPVNDEDLSQIRELSQHILKNKYKNKLFNLCAGLR
jgi:ribonuclease D